MNHERPLESDFEHVFSGSLYEYLLKKQYNNMSHSRLWSHVVTDVDFHPQPTPTL